MRTAGTDRIAIGRNGAEKRGGDIMGTTTEKPEREDLRPLAERIAATIITKPEADTQGTPPDSYAVLLHELLVHKLELEMQNEELRRAQTELEIQKARYFDLYDLAPVGYFSVDALGLILEANFTAATLLGLSRSMVVGQPITRFILKSDQDIYYLFRKSLLKAGETRVCELRMVKEDGVEFWAGLSAAILLDEKGAQVCRLTISDVSSRRRAEEDLRQSREEKEALLRELHRQS
jgi:PAS domain S-box-containing protein